MSGRKSDGSSVKVGDYDIENPLPFAKIKSGKQMNLTAGNGFVRGSGQLPPLLQSE